MTKPKAVVSESDTMLKLRALRTRTIQDANNAMKQIKQKSEAIVKKLDGLIAAKRKAEDNAVEGIDELS